MYNRLTVKPRESGAFLLGKLAMVNQQQLKEFKEIFLTEHNTKLSESELLSEALKLSSFAKTIISYKLKQNKNE